MPFIGGEVELGRWCLQSRRLWPRPLGVNTNSSKLVAEATSALKRQQRGGLGRREGCSEVGLGGGRHGVVSAAACGPVAGRRVAVCVSAWSRECACAVGQGSNGALRGEQRPGVAV